MSTRLTYLCVSVQKFQTRQAMFQTLPSAVSASWSKRAQSTIPCVWVSPYCATVPKSIMLWLSNLYDSILYKIQFDTQMYFVFVVMLCWQYTIVMCNKLLCSLRRICCKSICCSWAYFTIGIQSGCANFYRLYTVMTQGQSYDQQTIQPIPKSNTLVPAQQLNCLSIELTTLIPSFPPMWKTVNWLRLTTTSSYKLSGYSELFSISYFLYNLHYFGSDILSSTDQLEIFVKSGSLYTSIFVDHCIRSEHEFSRQYRDLMPDFITSRQSIPHIRVYSPLPNYHCNTDWLKLVRLQINFDIFYAFSIQCLKQASYKDLKLIIGELEHLLHFDTRISSIIVIKVPFLSKGQQNRAQNKGNCNAEWIHYDVDGLYIIIKCMILQTISQQIYWNKMSYLNAQQLQKSILGKSVLVNDPVRIQTAANLQNVPGIKMKTTTQQWANADICVICKQPFNPQRKINRHHCRVCGGSACGECSRKKINNERCCDFCFLKQFLKKQEHQRKQQFRLRQQNIQKMNQQIKQFEQQIQSLQKQIVQVEKANIELQVKLNKDITQKQAQIQKKQQQYKKRQQNMEKRKTELMAKKQQLQSREDRNKVYFSKVQIIKLDISSKQTSLLEKMEELERLKNQLDKLETQRRELMAEFK